MRIDKDNIKIILILLVVFLGIGYSYLNTNLNIDGTANINSAKWDVHFANVQVKTGSVEAATPSITNNTTLTFNITLEKPGDYYEFTVDAVNAGTIDAMIESLDYKLNGSSEEYLPAYIDSNLTYSDGAIFDYNQALLHDSTETYKFWIYYSTDINASDLPSTNQSFSIQLSIGYKQADKNSYVINHGPIIYALNVAPLFIGDQVGDNYRFHSAEEAIEFFENRPFCLKYIIENQVISESYVEFVVTEDMANANSGMTAGSYSFRGANPSYYESNKQLLQTAFGSANCQETVSGSNSHYNCSVSNLKAELISNGLVYIGINKNWGCQIYNNGQAFCQSNSE